MKLSSSPQYPETVVTIESLGGLGDGIATFKKKPVFVAKSCIGDVLKVRLVHENSDGYVGIISEIITPGKARVEAPCVHFATCGGCKMQQFSVSDYRAFKTRMFHSALTYGGFPNDSSEILFVPQDTRRRVEFRLSPIGLALLGLRSIEPVPIGTCLILDPQLQALIKPLNDVFLRIPLPIKSVSLTLADSGIDMLLTLRNNDFAALEKMLELIRYLPIARISARYEETLKVFQEFSPVTMRLGSYDVPLPADAFLQATSQGQEKLTQTAILACGSEATVDLFCGIGTYSFLLSGRTSVHAVEGDTRMVRAMESTIRHYGIESLTVEKRDLFKNPLTAGELKRFTAAIINPPRVGAKDQTEQLAQSQIKTVVMVSCNPATFSRDAKILKDSGFRLEYALGVDQFVWSAHLEIVAVFRR